MARGEKSFWKKPWFWIFIGWWAVPVFGVFWLIYQAGAKLYSFIERKYNEKLPPEKQINSGWGKIGSGVLALVVAFAACGNLSSEPDTAEKIIETAENQTSSYYDSLDEAIDKLPGSSETVSEPSEEPESTISSKPTNEPSREPELPSEPIAPVIEESSEPEENSEVSEVSEVESTELEFVSCPDTVYQGSSATVRIKGTPGIQYSITVEYKSGPSSAQGLEPKTANSNGEASWTWEIGRNTSTSFQPIITVTGDDQEISRKIKVSE